MKWKKKRRILQVIKSIKKIVKKEVSILVKLLRYMI